MKKLLFLLTLPIFACGRLADSLPATTAPLLPPTIASPAHTESQPEPSPAPPTQTEPPPPSPTSSPTPIPSASEFPDARQYEWRRIASGLKRPVDIQSAGDGSGRLFIVEKYGVIRVYQNGQLLDQSFLNIADRVNDGGNEMGLLGLAFHPNYEQNGYFYVNYTGSGGHTRISRFQASENAADPNSEKVLMVVKQPYRNHNGGALAFGPDGYLYVALGDGGSAGDPQKNGQNPRTLLGSILRIDVDNGDPYAIPPDNPFGNEVWAYGLRNPWRISFDRLTGDLWIGDVGQNKWEEIDYLPAGSPGGANFGWSIMEGNHPFDGSPQPGLLLPVMEYGRESGCSVTGGYVYRGAMPEWNGIYLFGDYCSGKIWGLMLLNGERQARVLFKAELLITSFGQDEAGEVYLASDTGSVHLLAKK